MKQSRTKWLLGIGILIATIMAVLNGQRLNQFPQGIHAWSQADHYAISEGFIKNGFNFFRPETNYLFPEHPEGNGITPVEFPIHHYVPALIKRATGAQGTWPFRLYLAIYGFVGLLFLFRLTEQLTYDKWKAAFVSLFAATSPVFLYYSATFLPSIPSLANAFIGLHFYFKFRQSNRSKHLYLGLLFLTLSALSRLPFAMVLISCLFVEILLPLVKMATFNKKRTIGLIAGLVLVGCQVIYNSWMAEQFHSLFLTQLMAPSSWQEASSILDAVWNKHALHYLTTWHYLTLVAIGAWAMYHLFIKKRAINRFVTEWSLLATLLFFGGLSYSLLMLQQFEYHDYYFLDAAFVPTIVLLMLFLAIIPPIIKNSRVVLFRTCLVLITVGMVFNAALTHNDRLKPVQLTDQVTRNFQHGAALLNTLEVSPDDRVLIIDAYTPPIPLLLCKRKGFVVVDTSPENLKASMEWPWQYAIMQNQWITSEVLRRWPQALQHLKRIGGDENLSVYVKSDQRSSPVEFVGAYQDTLVNNWVLVDSTIAWSAESPYGPTLTLTNEQLSEGKRVRVLYGQQTTGQVDLVVSYTTESRTNLDYQKVRTINHYPDAFVYDFPLPVQRQENAVLKVYPMKEKGLGVKLERFEVQLLP